MENCKKCNKNFKSISGLCTHLRKEHNLSFKEYLKEILDIPLCPYCNNKFLKNDFLMNVYEIGLK